MNQSACNINRYCVIVLTIDLDVITFPSNSAQE